jgi:hypothetical protein
MSTEKVDDKADDDATKEELEAQWAGINKALEPFFRGETTDTVFVRRQLHSATLERLRATYLIQVSEWAAGSHMITRKRATRCENEYQGRCLLKCQCPE